ncbi:hypothetical protein [Marispirochaeta aestuarii]|uniref:lipopolysaccharide biosynthesis protein n=1 Tax=Marispirochaeta aestuarii TaxID=1963862 RepID=UPI0029C615D4|nr:hypothetical protein [Marispirochaeta aestuarii]
MKKIFLSAVVNTAGTITYYLSLWLITMVISKLSLRSYYDVGVFSIAMSFGNIFFSIAHFGARELQISDINNEYKNNEYHAFRIITCLGSIVLCVICALVLGYREDIIIAITIFIVYKAWDAYSDVFYGFSQIYGHLEYAGYSMFIKGILIFGFFTMILTLTQNIQLSMLSLVFCSAGTNILYDQRKVAQLSKSQKIELREILSYIPKFKKIFLVTFPLMLNTIIIPLMIAIPRLLLEKIYDAKLLGIFTSVTAPTVVISTFITTAALPLIPSMAEAWLNGKRMKFIAILGIPAIIVLLICLSIIPFALRFGGMLLTILYTEEISSYVSLFVLAIVVSCLLSCVVLFNNTLVSMRKIKELIIFSLIACFTVMIVSIPFIKKWALYGALYALGIAYSFQFILQFTYILYKLIAVRKSHRHFV